MTVLERDLMARHDACRRRVFDICNRFGLSDADRWELATVLFDRNIESYKQLSPPEWARLRDSLEGAAIICLFQMQRARGERL